VLANDFPFRRCRKISTVYEKQAGCLQRTVLIVCDADGNDLPVKDCGCDGGNIEISGVEEGEYRLGVAGDDSCHGSHCR